MEGGLHDCNLFFPHKHHTLLQDTTSEHNQPKNTRKSQDEQWHRPQSSSQWRLRSVQFPHNRDLSASTISSDINTTFLQTAVDYLEPANEPEPSAETGLGTHFTNTFSKTHKENAPNQAPEIKLKNTDSTMTTAQLQQAAADAQYADPNTLKKMGIGK